jgi:transposase
MRKPIPLRLDYDAARLRRIARESEDADQVRRLLALAVIYDGGSRTQAAEVGGVTLQVVRDWVLRFNAEGAEGLIDRKAPGQPSRLKDEHRIALAAMVENGPIPAVHGVVRWRVIDLCQWVWDEFAIIISQQTLSRELRAMAIASCRRAHVTMPRRPVPSRRSKKVFRTAGKHRAQARRRSQQFRNLVRRRGPDRSEEQDHPALGQAR